MFEKSTHFKQVCQLLLSLIVAISHFTLNRCFKTIIINNCLHYSSFIDGHSECFFYGLHDIFLKQLSSGYNLAVTYITYLIHLNLVVF